MMKKWAIFAGALVLVCGLSFAGGALLLQRTKEPVGAEAEPVVSVALLKTKLSEIGELATLQYDYSNVIQYEQGKTIKGFHIPFTKKSFIATFDGTMKFGFDAADISIKIDETAKKATIQLPQAKLLSHEVHENSVRVLDQSSGLFNPVKISDYVELMAEEKNQKEKAVWQNGFGTKAQEQAKPVLGALVQSMLPSEEAYAILWEF